MATGRIHLSPVLFQIIIFTSLCHLIIAFLHHRSCSHRFPKDDEVLNHVQIEPAHKIKKRSINQNLRIHLSYDKSMYRLPSDKFKLITTEVLPKAIEYWEQTLMVRPMHAPIKLSRKCKTNQVFYPHNTNEAFCKIDCDDVTMCGEVVVPEEHLENCRICNSQGKNCGLKLSYTPSVGISGADFVFYVSAMETVRCHKNQTVAYAAHCQQEAALDRPIAGHANLCPGSISTKPQDMDTLLSTVKHEILHALGFSVSLYAFYRDKDGEPLTERGLNGKPVLNERLQTRQWSEKTIKTVIRRDWKVRNGVIDKRVHLVVTPQVVREVKKHFGCPYLEGAELEDQGEDGTVLTHWEKRLFENEAMTGTHTQNPVYSRITLALMEDTGWYLPNYRKAQELEWGRNLGCQFTMKSCKDWMDYKRSKGEHIHPFCDKVKSNPLETECTENRDSVALCNLVKYEENLPTIYQNFDNLPRVNSDVARYGGSVALADFCPYIQEFTWKSENLAIRGSHCGYHENNPKNDNNFALEFYGKGSKCFDHTDMAWEERTCRQIRQWHHWGSGCYKYNCSQGRLHIQVSNYTYTCYRRGQVLDIKIYSGDWLHIGAIVCPPCQEICQLSECLDDVHPDFDLNAHIEYPGDELKCAASTHTLTLGLVAVIICFLLMPFPL